ncbi:MAG: ABC transporter substrate-binding protein, partial [Bacteroidota bacterium]
TSLIVFLFATCTTPSEETTHEITVRMTADPESLHPFEIASAQSVSIINLLYQGLLKIDISDGKIKPCLAKAMPIVERKDSVTFIHYEIHPAATWDNGQPITATDVAFTLKVFFAPLVENSKTSAALNIILDIILATENEKKFTLICEGYSADLVLLSGDFAILPTYLLDPKGKLAKYSFKQVKAKEGLNEKDFEALAAITNTEKFTSDTTYLKGSAGYVLEEWQNNEVVRLRKKPNWWAATLNIPYLHNYPDRITYQIIPDDKNALLALKNNKIDVLSDIATEDFEQLKAQAPENFYLESPVSYRFLYLGMNARSPKLSAVATRQALAHLLDYDNLIKVSEKGYAERGVSLIRPADAFYHQDLPLYPFDPAKAKDLLEEAGWQYRDGRWQKGPEQALSLELRYAAGQAAQEAIALALQQEAKKIGIVMTLLPMERSSMMQEVSEYEYELFFGTLSGSAYSFNFKPILHRSAGRNVTSFGTEESDAIVDQLYVEADEQQRKQLVKRFQEIMKEQANIVCIYFKRHKIAVSKRFANVAIAGHKQGYEVSSFQL